jgi:hypothetical protein
MNRGLGTVFPTESVSYIAIPPSMPTAVPVGVCVTWRSAFCLQDNLGVVASRPFEEPDALGRRNREGGQMARWPERGNRPSR